MTHFATYLEDFFKKIFWGRIPEYFQLVLNRERKRDEREVRPLYLQNVENPSEINHFEYIFALQGDMSSEMLDYIKNATPEQMQEMDEANRILLVSIALRLKNSKESIWSKYECSCCLYEYLDTLIKYADYDLNSGVGKAFQIIKEHRDYYQQKIKNATPNKYIVEARKKLDVEVAKLATKKKAVQEIAFTSILENQRQRLINFFIDRNLTNAPTSLADFFIGKYDGRTEIEIKDYTPTKKDKNGEDKDYYRLLFTYLVFNLYQHDLIKLNRGKAYRKYIENNIRPFSMHAEKSPLTRMFRIVNRNNKLKPAISKEVDLFIQKLSDNKK